MSSYSSLNHLLPPSETTSILSSHSYTNGVSLEEGNKASSSLLRDTGQSNNHRQSSSASTSATNNNSHRQQQQNQQSDILDCFRTPFLPKFRVFIALILFVILSSTFAILSYLHYSNLPCTSTACVMTAARILQRMDLSTSPCDNFYQFACGNWINQSVNINYGSWNTLYETQMKAHDQIVNAMERINDKSFPLEINRGERAAAELYRQCTDMDTLEQTGLATWKRFVEELGGWMPELREASETESTYDEIIAEQANEFEIEDTILAAFNYSVFPLFWAGVEVNYRDSNSHLITIYEQLPILLATDKYQFDKEVTPEMIYSKQDGPAITRALQDVGEQLAELLGFDRTNEKVRMMIAHMIHLEYKITISGSTFYEQKKERYEVLKLRDLQLLAPAINWRYFLSNLVRLELDYDEPIALKTGVQWIQTLSRIIARLKQSSEGVAVIKNYIKWKTILFHLAYANPKCQDGLLWMAVSLYTGPRNHRKEFCVLRLTGMFPLSLPSILRKVDGMEHAEKNKKLIEKMSDKIGEKYSRMTESSEILSNDPATRQNVLDKIGNVTKLISYPDKMTSDFEMNKEASRISDQLFWSMVRGSASVYKEKLARLRKKVDQRDWVDTRPALSVPAHNYERNLIQIPFDSMRIPYADISQMEFANYAGIGTIIGHELTHAFDGQGKLHGPTGNLGNWWGSDARRRFSEKEQCFIRQYTELTGSEDNTTAKAGLYENIADFVGLKVAFETWRENGENQGLKVPGLEDYSQRQLFFLSYAQGWCALRSKQAREVHMEEKFRMLGSLQNSQHFADAWKCPSSSYMNPPKKCDLW